MKPQMLFLVLFFVASVSFAQEEDFRPDFTNVHHSTANITVRNFDNTRATIHTSGGTATLFNSDGSQSTIDGFSKSIIAADGTRSSIASNGMSSTVTNSDGTQLTIVHKLNSSSSSTAVGSHSINHFFGNVCDMRWKKTIDILLHTNYYMQQKELLIADAESIDMQK